MSSCLVRATIIFAGLFCAAAASAVTTVSSEHDYHKVQDYLKSVHAQYPQTTTLFSIGVSGTGESIDGIKIGTGSTHHLIVATHHGNEYGSTEVALGAIADFAQTPLDGKTIYVIPVLNISGFNKNRREESLLANSEDQTADANRDYPGPCGTNGPFHLLSTKALADFVDKEDIIATATLHTFWPVVAYPWGFATPDLSTPYDKIFIDLANAAASVSQYTVGNSTAAIYPAPGTYEDYVFWKHGIWSLLFELGESHSPSDADLQTLVSVNVPGLRKMMEQAPTARAQDHEFHGKCDGRAFVDLQWD